MQFRYLLFGLALSLITVAGCQDYYFETITVETIKEQTVIVPAAKPIPADIIFIVDNSTSMEDEQDLLGRSFASFIRQLVGSGDYRIAIISTEVLSGDIGYEHVGSRTIDFSQSHPRRYLQATPQDPLDPNRCLPLNGQDGRADVRHGCFRQHKDSEFKVITSKMTAEDQRQAFEKNVALGSCGLGNESGLEALRLMLAKTSTSGCNAGFLRPEANLVLIFVSDEDDQESNVNVSQYVQLIEDYKDVEKIRVGVITGTSQNGEASNCRIGGDSCGDLCNMRPPDGSLMPCTDTADCINDELCFAPLSSSTVAICNDPNLQYFDRTDTRSDEWCRWCSFFPVEGCCSAMAGTQYVNFARAIERAVTANDPNITATNCRREAGKRVACLVDTICQADFSDTLKAIARDLVSTDKYSLDPPACNPEGVVVQIGGKPLVYQEDYELSEDGSELVLTGAKPGPNDKVEIFFVVDGCRE